MPKFLLEAYRVNQAERLANSLHLADVGVLRALVSERVKALGEFVGGIPGFYLFEQFDPTKIGTR